jgi:histidine ammonia-lyase
MAKVTVDVEAEITRARRVLNHLAERRVDVYGITTRS